MELIDGAVELIRLRTWHAVALDLEVYVPLIEGTLFDSGQVTARKQLMAFLRNRKIKRIIHTHGHEDHIGNDAKILQKHHCEIWAPELSLDLLTKKQKLPPYRNIYWGTPTPIPREKIKIVPKSFSLGKNNFQTIPIPGHSEDLVGFYEAERGWFIAGDLFLGEHVKTAVFWENNNNGIESLERVVALNPKILFCYHLGAIYNPVPRLQKKIDFFKHVRDETKRLYALDMPTDKIVEKVLRRENKVTNFLSSNEISRINLIRSFLKEPGVYDPL